ncbi:MAG: cytochrome c maturation protein CcmE [Gammaproteobacteria bacterium]|nr:cytochrome c maturation protein CcmE [Gammaproteobacteria bacterium]MYF02951.1 cytochrome c maturation protein CcmE [Gammaproteobacteria bacterium]MYI76700.1 cytochrome c maturation protein CcmE [Gammaproteobacteria bacterium]
MKSHRRRKLTIIIFLFVGSLTTVLISIFALQHYIDHFYSPEEIVNGEVPLKGTIRAGGMVKPDSLVYDSTGLGVQFDITDLTGATVRVHYEGILPSLFREGQGTIVHGNLNEKGLFIAKRIRAKHDESYVPPELEGLIEYDDS